MLRVELSVCLQHRGTCVGLHEQRAAEQHGIFERENLGALQRDIGRLAVTGKNRIARRVIDERVQT